MENKEEKQKEKQKEKQIQNILSKYDDNKMLNGAFKKKLHSFTAELLAIDNIHVHALTSRVKERSSLEKKLRKKENYSSLDDITDVTGVRIVRTHPIWPPCAFALGQLTHQYLATSRIDYLAN